MFKINFSKEATKKLNKLSSREKSKIFKKLDKLTLNPYLGKPLQGKLKGKFSLRVWPLRVIYTVDFKSQNIIIVTLGHRGDVYKQLTG